MNELVIRLYLWLNVVIPLVFFMAATYLVLHILFSRLVTSPASPVLWFFSVVTGPLTRPIRRVLAPDTPEGRIRAVTLAVYVALWLASRAFFVWLGAPHRG